MLIEALVTHKPVAIAIITLFLCQMAMLKGTISTYFGKGVAARGRRRLTCETRAIASRCKGLGRKRTADRDNKTRGDKELFYQGLRVSAERCAHPSETDQDLEIVAGQCALGKWMRNTART
jgi:hypothetical protein